MADAKRSEDTVRCSRADRKDWISERVLGYSVSFSHLGSSSSLDSFVSSFSSVGAASASV